MRRSAFLLPMLGLAFAPVVWAQPAPAPKPSSDPPIETVIVTAPKYHFGVTPNAIAHDFIGSYAMPSVLTGTIPRWRVSICPEIRGVWPQFAEVMDARLRKIAAYVGAPVAEKGCRPNLSITFTPEPQKLLDNIDAKNSDALGYHASHTISHPVQAWYATGTADLHGKVIQDREVFVAWEQTCDTCPFRYTSETPVSQVGGWRGRVDASSELMTVTIIVDTNQTSSYQVGEIADYVAMMALTRSEDYDDCQLMPSITNLLSPNCDDKLKPSEITASDIAYLRGVYKMDAGATLQIQQNQIAAEMQKALGGH